MKIKGKYLVILGNILLAISCILEIIIDLKSEVYISLFSIAILLELFGIAISKDK